VALVRLGRVVRAVGLQGILGVAGTEGGVGRVAQLTLRRPGERDAVRAVLEARPQGRLWAVRLDGIADRAEAERWVGAEVLAERGELGEAGDGLHYWSDLEGLEVETVAGVALGRVTGLYPTGGVDVLVVTGEAGERLIPLAPYVTVDREAGVVRVDPPEGLLDGEEPGRGRSRGHGTWRSSRSRS
jgi:16S rRNA processing protein RimM